MLRAIPIPGNRQRLDGGAMFGNVPRALWSRWCPADDQGRIELATRAVLIDDAERLVLLEAGIGAFFEPKLRERYGIVEERHVLLDSLEKAGYGAADIDVIVLSHLHFDHVGGILAPFREGAPLALAFPNAAFVVGRTAFERARSPHRRDRASFVEGVVDLLTDSGRLHVVEPGEPGAAVLGERFRFRETAGHTPGLLHTIVLGQSSRLFYGSDLVPGTPWVHLPVTMGYDRFPEQLVDEKAAVLAELEKTRAWLSFTHDVRVAFARVESDGRGSYRTKDERGDHDGALDLDS